MNFFSEWPTTEVLILRGLPGSGKSTLAIRIAQEMALRKIPVVICSADHHFLDADGVYKFDPTKIGDAHATCFSRYLSFLPTRISSNDPKIIVDNTNVRAYEIAPYVLAANMAKAGCKVLTVWSDPATAWSRNLHGVPLKVVLDMHRAMLLESLPPFWQHEVIDGWNHDAPPFREETNRDLP